MAIRRRRLLTIVVASGLSMALPAGITSAQDASAPASAGAGTAEKLDIEFVAGIVGIPFYTSMECGARQAAADLGVNVNWAGPPDWSLELQLPLLQASIERDPDGLILAPTDPVALITTVSDLMGKGVPVVTVDGNLSEPVDVQNIRTDNLVAGGLAADAMGAAISGKGSVLVVGLQPGVSANQERVDGFVAELAAKYPEVTILPTEYPGADPTKAATAVSAAIQAHPDLAGIYTTHSNAAVGTSSAVIAASQQGKIKIIAYDADPQQVRDLRDGIYDGLVVQAPYLEGYDSVTLVTKILRGEVDPTTLEDVAHPPMIVATRDNVDSPEVQKYLYVDACS
ncbi:MAG: substrate-binding domain-containing protein [Chloroflexi bacterium]|nr:substrate-binding domain-containing protein [Chloroflexota bacterium]